MTYHFTNIVRKAGLPLLLATAVSFGACQAGKQSTGVSEEFETTVQSGKPLVKVGDYEIREGYLDLISRINPQLKAQVDSPAGRKKLLDTISEQELLYQASMKDNLENDPIVQQKIGLYRRVIIAQAKIETELQKRIETYYNEHKKDEFEQIHLAHLYVRTDADKKADPKQKEDKPADASPASEDGKTKASETLKKAQEALKSGTAFADVVTTYSDDSLTKKKGGDLGWVSRTDKRLSRKDWQPLVDKAFSMKPGEVSDVIETKNGLHIITVLEGPKVAALGEVENSIRLKVGASVKKDVIDDLKKTITITDLDAPPAPEKAATPPPVVNPHSPTPGQAAPAPEAKEPATAAPPTEKATAPSPAPAAPEK